MESGGRCRPLAGLDAGRCIMPWKWYTIGNEREACIGTRPVNTAGAVLTYASNSLTRLQRIHATTDILARQANPIRYLALKYSISLHQKRPESGNDLRKRNAVAREMVLPQERMPLLQLGIVVRERIGKPLGN